MLDDLNQDVDEAQERMNFVMDKMSKMLKTKGTYRSSRVGCFGNRS